MKREFNPQDPQRFAAARRRFDEENARDPNREEAGGTSQPRELLYAEWLTNWLLRLEPEASEELRLAARAQHLCRWLIPRDSFPLTRAGYLQWRQALKKLHAQKAGEILREVGYPEETVSRVQDLILKKHFPNAPQSQVLEDALCLVFLEHQFAPLAAKSSDEKMLNALQKSWKKMSPRARELALTLKYGEKESGLIQKALGS